jgi:DNA-binding transcriptional regulator YdaS (Cro superfamily)
MTDSEIIDALGGTAAVARMVRTSGASVSEWRQRGIPTLRRLQLAAAIERATNGRLTRKTLRPIDWAVIWPELAAANAPQPAAHPCDGSQT